MAYLTYRDLEVWQYSMDLVDAIYVSTRSLPETERFGLVMQMRRSAVSIPSNIAEGKARGTKKDYRRFIQTAYGSGAELETQIEICLRQHFFTKDQFDGLISTLGSVMRMLNKLIQRLS